MQVTRYPLTDANAALADLRAGRFEGAAMLISQKQNALRRTTSWRAAEPETVRY
jgi:hypothetical protein